MPSFASCRFTGAASSRRISSSGKFGSSAGLKGRRRRQRRRNGQGATLANEIVRLRDAPAVHHAILSLLAPVDLGMRRNAGQRAKTRSRLRRDKGLQPTQTNEIAKPAADVVMVAVHDREHQGLVMGELEAEEAQALPVG